MDRKGPREDKSLVLFKDLQELRRARLVPFTFGPMYVCGRVPFDTVDAFVDATGMDVQVTSIDFAFPIITLPEPYARRLYTMNDEAYAPFVEWIEQQMFSHPSRKMLARPVSMAAAILDPFQRVLNLTVPCPEVIDVISVSTNKGMVKCETHVETLPYPIFREGEAADTSREELWRRLPKPASGPLVIKLEQVDPDPWLVMKARAIFQ